jgi:orotate phosphoribosyltransferase
MGLRQRYVELLKQRAIRIGDFTLASGAKSNYYIDIRQMFFGEALYIAGVLLRTRINAMPHVDAIGGLETGSITLASSLLVNAWQDGRADYEGFYVRKEAKKHGTGSLIEGRIVPGAKVLIIDDVLTTGASALKAIEAVEAVGGEVVMVSCIIDRKQGAREALAKYEFWPLFDITDPDLGIPVNV